EPQTIAEHPWVASITTSGEPSLERDLALLAHREWPSVFQHGDLAPWNLIRGAGGEVRAIDWEYGSSAGFPHLDAVHYLLQVALLVKRLEASTAEERAAAYLTSHHGLHPSAA